MLPKKVGGHVEFPIGNPQTKRQPSIGVRGAIRIRFWNIRMRIRNSHFDPQSSPTKCWYIAILVVFGMAIGMRPIQGQEPIRTTFEAKYLPAVEAARQLPVVLHGVVACVPEGWKGFFLEDASGGIYCEALNSDAEASFWPMEVGEEVELHGVSAAGHRNSFVMVSKVASKTKGVLPKPKLRTIQNIIDDRVDADFVRVRGHIVGLTNIAGQMEYGLLSEGVEALVFHSSFRIDPKVYEPSEVEVCGIVIPQEGNARPVKIIVPNPESFKMLATHLDILDATPVSTVEESLLKSSIKNPVVRIAGDIFCSDADETWLVEKGFGIDWKLNNTILPEGTKRVEVLGVLKREGDRQWLQYGTVLSTSSAAALRTIARGKPVANTTEYRNQMVTLNATYWDVSAFHSEVILSFYAGDSKLTCRLVDDVATRTLPKLQRGAEYRVSGLLTPVSMDNVDTQVLLIRSLADIDWVAGPPWPIRFTLYIVSMLSAGLALGLATTIYCWKQANTAKSRLEIARNELHRANESLEARVVDRTLELDTTNRRLVEEAKARQLVEREQKETLASLEDAQSLGQMGSFIWQADTGCSSWSKQCSVIHGLEPSQRPPTVEEYCALVAEEDRTAFQEFLEQATRSSDREEFQYRIVLPNQEVRWIRCLIRSHHVDGVLSSMDGIVQNVTEQVKAEEQLRYSVKMEVAGHLAGGIAHDLNNTLAIVNLNCYLLGAELRKLPISQQVAEHVSAIESASEKSALLTRQLLTFSRKQIIRPVVLNINSSVQSFGPLLRQLIPDRIHIHFDLAENLANVRLDQGQLEQLLMNLVLNARDAITDEGRIGVRTSNVVIASEEDGVAWIVKPKTGSYVSLWVTDNGNGIAPECLPKIFEPFYTSKGPEKGTGLGLAVVHGIVRQNHGGLAVTSVPNQGTTFQLLMPIVQNKDDGAAVDPLDLGLQPVANQFRSTPERKESILLVDDEPSVGKHTEHVLKHLGYSVTTVTAAAEGLQQLLESPNSFQLLITDYSMPQMTGLELAKKVRAVVPKLPVILMSGYLNEEAFQSMTAGENPIFVQKPFTIPDLAHQFSKL